MNKIYQLEKSSWFANKLIIASTSFSGDGLFCFISSLRIVYKEFWPYAPTPPTSRHTPPSLPTQLCPLSLSFHSSMAALLENTSPNNSQLPIVLGWGGISYPPFLSMLGFGVGLVITATSSYVQLPCCVQRILIPCIHSPLLSLALSDPSFNDHWALGGEGEV